MPIPYGLLDPVTLSVPQLPRVLEGLRIAHLTDLHIRGQPRRYTRLFNQLTSQRFDLIVFTGDYMNRPRRLSNSPERAAENERQHQTRLADDAKAEEPGAYAVLAELCKRARPRLGAFGVFGNHDSGELRDMCQDLPVRWLSNETHRLSERPIEILGLDMITSQRPDSAALALSRGEQDEPAPLGPGERPLRLMLSHLPGALPTASNLGADVMLAGHTHGGQCRLPTGHPLVNSTDMPLRLTSGVLRYRHTLGAVSRGIGWIGGVPRVWCKPHVPVYTLRRGALPGTYTEHMQNLQPW